MADAKTVLVTGASGFVASWLVKKLLEKGYTVHATIRNPEDKEKTKHLQALPNAESNLRLFEADLLTEGSFEEAMKGCGGVFHTASPVTLKSPEDGEKTLVEPALNGTLNVLKTCKATPSVKRIVMTSSIAALKCRRPEGPSHFATIDESSWSDEAYMREKKTYYALSKTLAEKEAWSFAKENGLNLITILPSLVTGKMLQPEVDESSKLVLKYVTGEIKKFPNETQGWVHVEDVADAHILVYEKPEAEGRYICSASTMHWKEVCVWLNNIDPKLPVPQECEDSEPLVMPDDISSRKILALGLRFNNIETILRDFVADLREKGIISASS